MNDKLIDSIYNKYKTNKKMTLKEWQIIKSDHPSSLWHDFFPEYLTKNNVPLASNFTSLVWNLLWFAASEAHTAHLNDLVSKQRPTLEWRGRTYLL